PATWPMKPLTAPSMAKAPTVPIMKNSAATRMERRSVSHPTVPEYPTMAPSTGRLQHDVTDPIIPSKKAAGNTAKESVDDFRIAADHSSIIELRHFGQQDALV